MHERLDLYYRDITVLEFAKLLPKGEQEEFLRYVGEKLIKINEVEA